MVLRDGFKFNVQSTVMKRAFGCEVTVMSQEMECMCQQCGMSVYMLENEIVMEDPAGKESKLLSNLLVCQNCSGQLALVGKAGDEPHYRLK